VGARPAPIPRLSTRGECYVRDRRLLASLDEPRKAALERIRDIVHRTVPDAQEVMSCGMPAFRYRNAYLIAYCAHSKLLGFYPTAEPTRHSKTNWRAFRCREGPFASP